jgi:hypothetical protein
MLALLYPTPPGPTATPGNPWLALAITGAVLVVLVLFAWASMRHRRTEAEPAARPSAETPRAA